MSYENNQTGIYENFSEKNVDMNNTPTSTIDLSKLTSLYEGLGMLIEPLNGDKKSMNENELLKTYMDKVDQDQRDLKSEMREREARISDEIAKSEKRMDERMAHIEELLEHNIEKISDKVDNSSKEMMRKYDESMQKYDDSVKEIKNNRLQIFGIAIATVISVAAVCIAAIQVVQGIINIIQ